MATPVGGLDPTVLRPRPFQREGLGRRVVPFAAVTVVGFSTALVPPRPSAVSLLVAIVVLAAIAAAIALLPWERLPTWADPLPPLAYLAVVALLRDSAGGAVSGYAALYLVPVVWLALYGERRQVVLAVLGVGLAVASPLLLIGGESYPASEWRRVALMTGVAALTGWAVRSTVGLLREQTREVALLQAVTTDLAHLHTPSEVVAIILDAVAGLAGPDGGRHPVLFLRIDDDEVVVVAAATGRDGDDEALGSRFALADHPELEAVVRPVRAASGTEDGSSLDLIGRVATGRDRRVDIDHIYAPVIGAGELYGVVSVANPTGARSRDRVARVVTLATVGSIALTNALTHASVLGENLVLADAAERDPLTGLANRRSWDRTLRELERDPSGRLRAVHLGIIDLDHFKRYNDTHGHAAGDELLRDAAAAWSSQMRHTDLLARIGGEEFAFVVVDAGEAQADELAERLRAVVPHGATCSIGLARRAGQERLVETLARADAALYRAKRDGRDRVFRAEIGAATGPPA